MIKIRISFDFGFPQQKIGDFLRGRRKIENFSGHKIEDFVGFWIKTFMKSPRKFIEFSGHVKIFNFHCHKIENFVSTKNTSYF
jgi:hypothetical protein